MRAGLPQPVRVGTAEGPAPLLLVDRVGVLASLYGSGRLAYVGGGFGRAGLHSVLEPAAWGRPVLFGPRWRNSRDAGLLLQARAAIALPGGPGAISRLSEWWLKWIGSEEDARAFGCRGREV